MSGATLPPATPSPAGSPKGAGATTPTPSGSPSTPTTPQETLLQGALAAMKDAPPPLKAGIFGCLIIGVLALAVLGIPPYAASKELYALVIAAVFLLVCVVLFVYAYTIRPPSHDGIPPRPGGTPQPIPPALKPAPDPRVIRPFLDDARTNVRNYLHQLDSAVTDDDVRANLFLPVKAADAAGGGVTLAIPSQLCLRMNLADERDITFGVGEGATGQAYQKGEVLIACRGAPGSTDWDSKYRLTPEQVRRIHPDLKWVISLPVKSVAGTIVGVANVDCLKHVFTYDDLERSSDIAGAFVGLIGNLF